MPGRDSVAALEFGSETLGFVREELASAAFDFNGPLARRLLAVSMHAPFSFLSPEVESIAADMRRGGIDDGRSDARLIKGLHQWLHAPDEHRRVMVLEEPLGRREDQVTHASAVYHGDRVYFIADKAADITDITDVLRALSGYPGIGVLARVPLSTKMGPEFDSEDLEALALSAVAVLIRAWDDEAFAVTPVASRLTPDDLRCDVPAGTG